METYIKVNDANKLNALVPTNIRQAYGYPLSIDIYFMDVLRQPILCLIDESGEIKAKYVINTQLCDADKMATKCGTILASQEIKDLVIDYFEADYEYSLEERQAMIPYRCLNDECSRIYE